MTLRIYEVVLQMGRDGSNKQEDIKPKKRNINLHQFTFFWESDCSLLTSVRVAGNDSAVLTVGHMLDMSIAKWDYTSI